MQANALCVLSEVERLWDANPTELAVTKINGNLIGACSKSLASSPHGGIHSRKHSPTPPTWRARKGKKGGGWKERKWKGRYPEKLEERNVPELPYNP